MDEANCVCVCVCWDICMTGGEGRIKANPFCVLVLVVIATFITWHLGEGSEEKGRGSGTDKGRERKKKKMSS